MDTIGYSYSVPSNVSKTGRPPFPVSTMLRIHFMQQWFGLSDLAMEEALNDMALFREFAQLVAGAFVFLKYPKKCPHLILAVARINWTLKDT